jgi:antitoxin component YwqK of YwqJK toxin-antitoxin module
MYSADTLLWEKKWHDNGVLAMECTYKHNEQDGLYKEYYTDGKVRLIQEYVEGTKHGKYTSYFPNGKVFNDGYFVNGKAKELKFYNREGKYETTKTY